MRMGFGEPCLIQKERIPLVWFLNSIIFALLGLDKGDLLLRFFPECHANRMVCQSSYFTFTTLVPKEKNLLN